MQKAKGFWYFVCAVFLLLPTAVSAQDQEVDVSFSGEVRGRYEYRDHFDFISPIFQNYKTLRSRLGTMIDVGNDTKGFIQFQDFRFAGDFFPASGGDEVDLHQAYFEVTRFKDTSFGFRLGRQELAFGDERIIGADDWSFFGNTFDAASFWWSAEKFRIDAFWAQLVPAWGAPVGGGVGGVVPDIDPNMTLTGANASIKYLKDNMWDIYAFSLYDGDESFGEIPATPADNTWLWTLGTRSKGEYGDFSYNAEFAFQFGKGLDDTSPWSIIHNAPGPGAAGGADDVSAFAAAAGAAYTFPVDVAPQVRVGFAYATGDDTLDGDYNAFTPLFPSEHDYYGTMDYFTLSNLVNLRLGFGVTPHSSFNLGVDFHFFWLAKERGAWYQPYPGFFSGGFISQGFAAGAPGPTSSSAGNELDFAAKYTYSSNVSFKLGFSHFFAGSYLDDLMAPLEAEDSNWLYAQGKFSF